MSDGRQLPEFTKYLESEFLAGQTYCRIALDLISVNPFGPRQYVSSAELTGGVGENTRPAGSLAKLSGLVGEGAVRLRVTAATGSPHWTGSGLIDTGAGKNYLIGS